MDLLVLTTPGDPGLERLAEIPPDAGVRVVHTPEEAEIVLCLSGAAPLLRAAWPELGRVRWIHSRSAGVDHLLFDALVASPVVLTNSRGVFGAALGEFAATAVLFFAKDLRRMLDSQAAGRWAPFYVEPVAGRTATVVGLGDVGGSVARSLRGLGMRVCGVRRSGDADPAVDEVVPLPDLGGALERADVVVLATPLTAETRGMFGARELARMRPHAILVNVGRGATVDEPALVAALQRGAIRGAALDVFAEEPLPAGHPFYGMPNVLLSPHTADRVTGWEKVAMQPFLDNLRLHVAGQPLRNVVDKARGY